MALRNSKPLKWMPAGLSDTLDATNTFTGAMAALANLIPDHSTRGLWVCRPAATLRIQFPDGNVAFISAMVVVGTRLYGMIASGTLPSKDVPFCYDIPTATLQAIANITLANTPFSPPTSGPWIPPCMQVVGKYVVVCHDGFNTTGKFFGWIDTSTLTWNSGNTATNPLAAVPVAVFNFFGRAYYAVNTPGIAATVFSDVLDPLTVTLASQVLTYDDNVPINALGGLPLNNTQGSIIQTLVVFKGTARMYFITGDATTNDLRKDALKVNTGTLAPNSICPTIKGLAFMSPEGMRVINFQGNVSDPIGVDGAGVSVPFANAVVPSRIASACNGEIMISTVQNGAAAGTPTQEYWFDLTRNLWSGPHTLPASLIQPYVNSFLKSVTGLPGKLFTVDSQQLPGSVFVENGVQMTFSYKTALLPDTEEMCENSVVESTVDLAYTFGTPAYAVSMLDKNGTVLDTLAVQATSGAVVAVGPRNLAWHFPIVFRRASLQITGNCSLGAKFGAIRMRYERLGYLQEALLGST